MPSYRPSRAYPPPAWAATAAHCLLLLIAPWLSGCGGGGAASPSPTPTPAPPAAAEAPLSLTVDWGARSRGVTSPSSALSAVITLRRAEADGSDLSFTVNRASSPAAYTATYTSPRTARVGAWPLSVRFFADADGGGALVGTADATADLRADGTGGVGTVETEGRITSTEVPPGLAVKVGERLAVPLTARDASGALVAVLPGAQFFRVAAGSDCLALAGGEATGVARGSATVVGTVDGRDSPPAEVTVTSADDPDTGGVVFSRTRTQQSGGFSAQDAQRAISLTLPDGALSQPTTVSLEVRQRQRPDAANGDYVANANAADVYIDPDAMAADGCAYVEVPSPAPYDDLSSLVLVANDQGLVLPVEATYDPGRNVLVGRLTAGYLKVLRDNGVPGGAGKARPARSQPGPIQRVSVFAVGPSEAALSRAKTSRSLLPNAPGWFVYHPDMHAFLPRDKAADSMAKQRVAVVLHGNLNGYKDMADLAEHLTNGLRQQTGRSVYDAVWCYQYNWQAHIDTNGKQFAAALGDEMGGASTVDIYAHSMGGLVSRWALEKEGLGTRVRRLVTLGTPHRGVPKAVVGLLVYLAGEFLHIRDGERDLISEPNDTSDNFINRLNAVSTDIPGHSDTAAYFTLGGTGFIRYNLTVGTGIMRSTLPLGTDFAALYAAKFLRPIRNDGVVAEYSSLSRDLDGKPVVLGGKSAEWARDNAHHAALVFLSHDELKGSDSASAQSAMANAVRDWIVTSISGTVQ